LYEYTLKYINYSHMGISVMSWWTVFLKIGPKANFINTYPYGCSLCSPSLVTVVIWTTDNLSFLITLVKNCEGSHSGDQKTIQRINETKSWFFEKINKIDKPLANLTKWRREKTQINKIRDEKGNITTNTLKSKDWRNTLKTYIQSRKQENIE
jgi:hypothetical protein